LAEKGKTETANSADFKGDVRRAAFGAARSLTAAANANNRAPRAILSRLSEFALRLRAVAL
jgi:hypothetical protein